MPASLDEVETSDLPDGPNVPEQVVTFLASNRDRAFTRAEIATAIDEEADAVGTARGRRTDRDLVRHRGEEGAPTEALDRVTAAYDLHAATERLETADGGVGRCCVRRTTFERAFVSVTVEPVRGEVGRRTAPSELGADSHRPWLVGSSDEHPFHDERCIAVAVSTKSDEDSIPLAGDGWTRGGVSRQSFVAPCAVHSPDSKPSWPGRAASLTRSSAASSTRWRRLCGDENVSPGTLTTDVIPGGVPRSVG